MSECWSDYDAKFFDEDLPDGVPASIQVALSRRQFGIVLNANLKFGT